MFLVATKTKEIAEKNYRLLPCFISADDRISFTYYWTENWKESITTVLLSSF